METTGVVNHASGPPALTYHKYPDESQTHEQRPWSSLGAEAAAYRQIGPSPVVPSAAYVVDGTVIFDTGLGSTYLAIAGITAESETADDFILRLMMPPDAYSDEDKDLIERYRRDVPDVLPKVLANMFMALATVNERGVQHNDVNLSNIFINLSTFEATLIDFGDATVFKNEEGIITHLTDGTPKVTVGRDARDLVYMLTCLGLFGGGDIDSWVNDPVCEPFMHKLRELLAERYTDFKEYEGLQVRYQGEGELINYGDEYNVEAGWLHRPLAGTLMQQYRIVSIEQDPTCAEVAEMITGASA